MEEKEREKSQITSKILSLGDMKESRVLKINIEASIFITIIVSSYFEKYT